MRKLLLIVAMSALLFPSLLSALSTEKANSTQKAEVIADKAEIFLEASQHSIVIDTIARGTTVTLFTSGKKNKKWLYISYLSRKRGSQVTGFVDSHKVEIIEENPPHERENLKETAELSHGDGEAHPEETAAHNEKKDPAELSSLLEEMEKEKREKQEDAIQKESEDERQVILKDQTDTQEKKIPEKAGTTEQESQELQEDTAKAKKGGTQENNGQKQEEPEEVPEEVEELPKVLTKVSVKVPRANIRLMPTTQSAIIHQASSGTELKHLAKTGNWHRVNLDPDEEGLVLSGYIHQNIVNEIYETFPPPPDPEKKPETEPARIKEKEEPEPEPEPVQEIPALRKKDRGMYCWAGGGAGYTMPAESYFGKGVNFGVTFGLEIAKYLAVELRVPYFQSDVLGTAEGLSSGRLSSLSLMLSTQARYPLFDIFVPYLVAGGDYHLNAFRLNEEIAQSWNQLGFNIEESVDHTFGLHLGAGMDVFLVDNIALNMDVRYYTAKLTGKRTLANQISEEMTSGTIDNLTFNSLQAAISVKLFFDPLIGKK